MNRAIIALAVLVGCAETDTTETTDNTTTETTNTEGANTTETTTTDGTNITGTTEKTKTTTPTGETAVSSD